MGADDDIVGPINLGDPHEVSILELAEQVIEMTDSRSKIIHLPMPTDDPRQRRPDISHARDALGWEPTTPLYEGLDSTIRHFRASLGEQAPLWSMKTWGQRTAYCRAVQS